MKYIDMKYIDEIVSKLENGDSVFREFVEVVLSPKEIKIIVEILKEYKQK